MGVRGRGVSPLARSQDEAGAAYGANWWLTFLCTAISQEMGLGTGYEGYAALPVAKVNARCWGWRGIITPSRTPVLVNTPGHALAAPCTV